MNPPPAAAARIDSAPIPLPERKPAKPKVLARPDLPFKGIALILASTIFLGLSDVTAKYLSKSLHAFFKPIGLIGLAKRKLQRSNGGSFGWRRRQAANKDAIEEKLLAHHKVHLDTAIRRGRYGAHVSVITAAVKNPDAFGNLVRVQFFVWLNGQGCWSWRNHSPILGDNPNANDRLGTGGLGA